MKPFEKYIYLYYFKETYFYAIDYKYLQKEIV